jgi:glycosyltransferase involved in cell wall biosynthesis
MKQQTITAGIIIHNEAKTLERCLKSLVGVVDEIIVIHDGDCEDDSLKIAERYADKVIVRPYVGCCEGHYNFLKKIAKEKWLLLIDGDEYLSEGLAGNLNSLTSSEDISAYEVYWPTSYHGRELHLGLDKSYKRILFRKSDVTFEPIPHGKRFVKGKVKRIDYPLIHKPEWDLFDKAQLSRKFAWAPVAAKIIIANNDVVKRPCVYLIKSIVWPIGYFIYLYILRLYIIGGSIGLNYAIFYSRYNFLINWNLYKLTKNTRLLRKQRNN